VPPGQARWIDLTSAAHTTRKERSCRQKADGCKAACCCLLSCVAMAGRSLTPGDRRELLTRAVRIQQIKNAACGCIFFFACSSLLFLLGKKRSEQSGLPFGCVTRAGSTKRGFYSTHVCALLHRTEATPGTPQDVHGLSTEKAFSLQPVFFQERHVAWCLLRLQGNA